jgi:uncharacterized DUF497 family protein
VNIAGFFWIDEVVEKIARKHNVETFEVEQAFFFRPRFRFVEKGDREGEDVYAVLGRTEAGRYLTVFFVRKLDRRALPLSARDMTHAERKRYERK